MNARGRSDMARGEGKGRRGMVDGDDDRPNRPAAAGRKGRRHMADRQGRDDDDGDRRRDRRMAGRQEMLTDHLEKQAQQIESWKDNKEQIIDQRYEQIVSGQRPFPWGR